MPSKKDNRNSLHIVYQRREGEAEPGAKHVYEPWAPASLFSSRREGEEAKVLAGDDDSTTVAFIQRYLDLADQALATEIEEPAGRGGERRPA